MYPGWGISVFPNMAKEQAPPLFAAVTFLLLRSVTNARKNPLSIRNIWLEHPFTNILRCEIISLPPWKKRISHTLVIYWKFRFRYEKIRNFGAQPESDKTPPLTEHLIRTVNVFGESSEARDEDYYP